MKVGYSFWKLFVEITVSPLVESEVATFLLEFFQGSCFSLSSWCGPTHLSSLSLLPPFFTPTEIFNILWDDITRVGALFESPPSTDSWGFGGGGGVRSSRGLDWTRGLICTSSQVTAMRRSSFQKQCHLSLVIWFGTSSGWRDVHGQVDAGWRERAGAHF